LRRQKKTLKKKEGGETGATSVRKKGTHKVHTASQFPGIRRCIYGPGRREGKKKKRFRAQKEERTRVDDSHHDLIRGGKKRRTKMNRPTPP